MKGIVCASVSGQLRKMDVGAEILFSASTNETTIRNACVRLKQTGVGEWKVRKSYVGERLNGFFVRRVS